MYSTPQEEFWAGEFGNEYSGRNQGDSVIASNTALFTRVLANTDNVNSIIEFGCNIGLNLRAIQQLRPKCKLTGVEINQKAVEILREWGDAEVIEHSILDIELNSQYDLTLIKGVLIHINPEELDKVYTRLYEASSRYICIAEYYNPAPVTVNYRGHSERLFKRDFAGEMLDKFPDLKLVDYGFAYHRDPNFPQDDITWFLLQKP